MTDIRLLISDNALRAALTEQPGFTALGAVTAAADAAAAFAGDAAAVIADADLCDKKFWKILTESNQNTKKPCVFILGSAENAEGNATESFAKPVRLGHLISRLQFHLQANARRGNGNAQFGPYKFEPQNRQLVAKDGGEIVRLTEKETALLDYLSQSDAPVPREELLASIWGYDARIDTHTLETHIYRLRRKLGPEGGVGWLTSEAGGYQLKRENAA